VGHQDGPWARAMRNRIPRGPVLADGTADRSDGSVAGRKDGITCTTAAARGVKMGFRINSDAAVDVG